MYFFASHWDCSIFIILIMVFIYAFWMSIIKVPRELRRSMDEWSHKLEVFNKELENKEELNRDEEYNNWNKINALDRINSGLGDTEE